VFTKSKRGIFVSIRAVVFFFVPKPPTHIRFDEISSVDFLRVVDSTNKTFDLAVNLKNGSVVQFKSFQRDEYSPLFNFFTKKRITILNFQDMPAGVPVDDVESSVSESEGEGEKNKRPSRAVGKDVRLRVRQAMRQEQIDSDESDQDFGFNAQNPEEEDVAIDSTEIDSASDLDDGKDGDEEKKQKKPNSEKGDEIRVSGVAATTTTKKRKRPDLNVEILESAKGGATELQSEPPIPKRTKVSLVEVTNSDYQKQ